MSAQISIFDFLDDEAREIEEVEEKGVAITLEQAKAAPISGKSVVDASFELEKVNWSDDQITQLMTSLIKYSIQQLCDAAFGRKPREEALSWIMGEDDESPFSFVCCCVVSGFDPEELRNSLRRSYKKRWGESI